jgi:hypothetical protein
MQAQRFVRIAAIAIASGVVTSLLITFDAAANGTTLTVPYRNYSSGEPVPESAIPMFEIKNNGSGIAGRFEITNPNSAAIALDGVSSGTGHGLLAWNLGLGRGAVVITSNSQNTLPALDVSSQSLGVPQTATSAGLGAAADIRANNVNSTNPAAKIRHVGQGAVLQLEQAGSSGDIATLRANSANVARIARSGKGFFAGGVRTGQHGITESIAAAGAVSSYSTGDVLVVASGDDSQVTKSSSTYSRKVAGVVAGGPGVQLTGASIDSGLGGLLNVGILGVFDVHVVTQTGAIARGDLLTTSSTAGAAMKATNFPTGAILGKALANYGGSGVGRIPVLVMLQ